MVLKSNPAGIFVLITLLITAASTALFFGLKKKEVENG
jgi:hypothetical protein